MAGGGLEVSGELGFTEIFSKPSPPGAEKRTTYPQNWPAYNAAQTTEQDEFKRLLGELCANIETPAPKSAKGGRPTLPLRDAVFAVVFKIYSTFSGRRFISDLRSAHEEGYISKLPHFNSIFNYLENPDMFFVLRDLIVESAKPLASVESDFAADSSGFSSSRFVRWYDHKYGGVRMEHDWVKVHLMCGVKTNIVTAAEIFGKHTNDAAVLSDLVKMTTKNFKMEEVSADKAYLSVKNLLLVKNAGAVPYIPFKINSTVNATHKGGIWKKMFHYFNFKREEFMNHYHKRSNVESTFSMIKAKFGDAVRSKTEVAMQNEALCKVLCHNICCLISAMFELGIDPKFAA